jgi:capsular exopolysaccharide synthesis family protein
MDSGYAALRRLHLPRIWTDNGRAKLLAGIPLTKLVKRNLVRNSGTVMSADSAAAVSLRRLKRSLLDRAGGPPQAIVVASPGSGEGRSFVALNLALAFAAEKGRNVLLVDADFRKPSIGNRVRPAPTLGLSEVLEAGIELDHALLDLVNSPLKILPAGAPPREPAELLTSDRARAIFRRLRDRFQTIIIDTPPILPFVDADLVGALSDGFLLLARAEMTENPMFLQAMSQLTSKPILGRVLNGTAS